MMLTIDAHALFRYSIVIWILIASFYFAFRLNFVNFRLMCHAFSITFGIGRGEKAEGELSSFQALMMALSGTVGLGNIAGTALGVTIGGPGVVLWMVVAGILGMCLKFSEITMAHKFRFIDNRGVTVGGSFEYIRRSFADIGHGKLGLTLAGLYAFLLLMSCMTGGNAFQANQLFNLLNEQYLQGYAWAQVMVPVVIILVVAVTSLGGLRVVGRAMSAVLPAASLVFVVSSIAVIAHHGERFLPAVQLIVTDAFTGKAAGVGILGAIFIGVQRAFFASGAGLGISTVIHAAAQTHSAAREGCVGMLEPFLDTVIICAVCGLVIVTSGANEVFTLSQVMRYGGVILSNYAYGHDTPMLGVALHGCIIVFSLSVMVAVQCIAIAAWNYLFDNKGTALCKVLYVCCTGFGLFGNFGLIISAADIFTLSLSIPNVIALWLLSGTVKQEKDEYLLSIRSKSADAAD